MTRRQKSYGRCQHPRKAWVHPTCWPPHCAAAPGPGRRAPPPLLRVWPSARCVLSVGARDRSPNAEAGAQGNKGAPSAQCPCSVLRVWPRGVVGPPPAGPRAVRLPLAPEAPLGAEHQNAKKGFSSQDSPLPKNKNQITRKLNPEACEKGTPAARPSPCQEGKVVCFCNIQKQST